MKTALIAWLTVASFTVTPPDLGSDTSWNNYLTAYPDVLEQIVKHEKWVKWLPPDKSSWVEQMDQQFDADPVWAKEALSFMDAQTSNAEAMAAMRALDMFLGDNRLFEAAELVHSKLLLNENYARAYRDLVASMADAPGFEYHTQCWNYFHSHRDEADTLFNTNGKGGIETYRRQYPGSAPLWQPCLDFMDRNPSLYDSIRHYYGTLKAEPQVSSQIDRMTAKLRDESNEVMVVELWRLRTQMAKNHDFWIRYLNQERALASRGDNGPVLMRLRRSLSSDPDTASRAIQYRQWVLKTENLSRRMDARRQKLKELHRPVVLGKLPDIQN